MLKYFLLVLCIAIVFLSTMKDQSKYIKLCGRSDLKIEKDLLRELNTDSYELKGCVFEISSEKKILHTVNNIIITE